MYMIAHKAISAAVLLTIVAGLHDGSDGLPRRSHHRRRRPHRLRHGTSPPSPSSCDKPAVIVDIGSSGLTVLGFQMIGDAPTQKFKSPKVEPGLQKYPEDPAGFAAKAEAGLEAQLVAAAEKLNCDEPSLFFLATAGMRMVSHDQQDKGYTQLLNWIRGREKLQNYFRDGPVARTIAGREEALFEFLTVNTQHGGLRLTDEGGQTSFIVNSSKILQVLELGGASAQVAAMPLKYADAKMGLESVRNNLIDYSFLQFGWDQALQWRGGGAKTIMDHCDPSRGNISHVPCNLFWAGQANNYHQLDVAGETVGSVPGSKFKIGEADRFAISDAVRSAVAYPVAAFKAMLKNLRTLGFLPGPPGDSGTITLSDWTTSTEKLCGTPWPELQAKNAKTGKDKLPYKFLKTACAMSTYSTQLLDSFGVEDEQRLLVDFADNPSWTTGAFIALAVCR